MRTMTWCLLALILFTGVIGCTRHSDTPPTHKTQVSSTKAFQSYFGPPPTTDKGTCFAFVIYFPSAGDPGKVIPFPFFSFDQASLKKVAVQRLLTGMADLKSYQGEVLQPFPTGTRLLDLSQKDDTVTVNFSAELAGLKPGEATEGGLANALALTLRQFEGVKQVRLQVAGKDSDLNRRLVAASDQAVLPLPPPRLLSVTAMREQGARNVNEVNAFFDRPVEIKSLKFAAADGTPFKGDIFQSVFDMAGVLKPKDPGIFKAGMPIRVTFNVTDKLGRSAAGASVFPLEVKDH